MNRKSMGELIDYLRTVPKWHDEIGACFDGYIFVQDDEELLDSDKLYEIGFVYDKQNNWYAFDADRGV